MTGNGGIGDRQETFPEPGLSTACNSPAVLVVIAASLPAYPEEPCVRYRSSSDRICRHILLPDVLNTPKRGARTLTRTPDVFDATHDSDDVGTIFPQESSNLKT